MIIPSKEEMAEEAGRYYLEQRVKALSDALLTTVTALDRASELLGQYRKASTRDLDELERALKAARAVLLPGEEQSK